MVGRRDIPGPGQWPKRKGDRDQHPEDGGDDQRAGVHAWYDAERQQRLQQARRQGRQTGADSKSDDQAETGQSQDLQKINLEDQNRRRAQAFQGGDGARPLVQIGGDRVGDADTADQKRGQPDEGQKQGHAVDKPAQPRRHLVGSPHPPSGARKRVVQAGNPGLGIGRAAPSQSVAVADLAAQQDKPGGFQRRPGHHQARPEGEHRGDAVGLALDYAP